MYIRKMDYKKGFFFMMVCLLLFSISFSVNVSYVFGEEISISDVSDIEGQPSSDGFISSSAQLEADISGSAINKTYDFYTGPCSNCGNQAASNITKYNLWSKYVDIMPFNVPNASLDGNNLPAIEDMVYDETTNYGLNLSLTVRPDLTEMIVDNRALITYPLGLQLARDYLQWMAFNPPVRVNPSAHNAGKDVILYELDGASDTQADSIKVELDKALNALAFDLSNLSAALPKNKPSRIKTGAV